MAGKVLAGIGALMLLTACELALDDFFEKSLQETYCDDRVVPSTPDGRSEADVEREIYQLCRD